MPTNEIVITPEGTIRTPSPDPNSMHEFKVSQGRVLYRWIHPDGSPHNDGTSEWMYLSTDQINQHYYNGPPRLRNWFNDQGITKEWLEESLAAERQAKRRRGRSLER